MGSIYGNYDTRKVWVREDDATFVAHNGIIVDCRVDDIDNMQSITYMNGNSVHKPIETCVGKWRRAIVWYGDRTWHITDYGTGIILSVYGDRADALAHVAYDEGEFYDNSLCFEGYDKHVEKRRRDMWNLRLYLGERHANGRRETRRVTTTDLAAWVATSRNAFRYQ